MTTNDAGLPALHYLPISTHLAARVRQTRKDDFGHDAVVYRDAAPCRVCLRIGAVPENLLLLSYRPLDDCNPYAEVGPIFIHEDPCEPYSAFDAFPEDFVSREVVIRAYDREGRIAAAMVAQPGLGADAAAEFLRNPEIAEVHVRHVSYTCYDFKIVRASQG